MKENSDVIIIGGGINGVSTAFYLAQQGARVTLIEKRFIASGPTGYSSAIIRQHYSNPVTARMALESLRVWKNFSELIGGNCGFTQCGFIMAVQPPDVEGLKANIRLQQSVGIQTSFVSPQEIKEIDPHADVVGIGGAAYEPEGGYCDASTAANAFAQAAQRLGTRMEIGVEATRIQVESGRVVGVETSQGFYPAPHVVVVAGPWTPRLLSHLGVEFPSIAARIKIGFYRRPAQFDRHCVWGDFANQIYLRPETGNLTLVGSISPDEANDTVADPDNFRETVELEVLADFAERAVKRFPALEQSHVLRSYAALYDVTPDWHPILDGLPGVEGLYVCAGSSGHGFKLAPAAGKMMAKLIMDGKKQDDDIELFSFERFEKGNLVRGQYAYSIVG